MGVMTWKSIREQLRAIGIAAPDSNISAPDLEIEPVANVVSSAVLADQPPSFDPPPLVAQEPVSDAPEQQWRVEALQPRH